jgi:molybdopterin-guanine dinucleotide biosynthesis protein A
MSTSPGLTGFILAGGKSARMGRDKALLDWHGRTLLDHMTELISNVTDEVHVIGRARFPDRLPGLGPLSGIATALETSATDANLVVAVDLPKLTRAFLKYLTSEAERANAPLAACKIGSEFPLCLVVQRRLLPEIQHRLASQDLSVHALIENTPSRLIYESELLSAGFNASLFRNINTEQDYRDNLA